MLHGWRVGVSLQDGWKLKGQNQREQLLQHSGREETVRERRAALQSAQAGGKLSITQNKVPLKRLHFKMIMKQTQRK